MRITFRRDRSSELRLSCQARPRPAALSCGEAAFNAELTADVENITRYGPRDHPTRVAARDARDLTCARFGPRILQSVRTSKPMPEESSNALVAMWNCLLLIR